jgi:hypothetical protein
VNIAEEILQKIAGGRQTGCIIQSLVTAITVFEPYSPLSEGPHRGAGLRLQAVDPDVSRPWFFEAIQEMVKFGDELTIGVKRSAHCGSFLRPDGLRNKGDRGGVLWSPPKAHV